MKTKQNNSSCDAFWQNYADSEANRFIDTAVWTKKIYEHHLCDSFKGTLY